MVLHDIWSPDLEYYGSLNVNLLLCNHKKFGFYLAVVVKYRSKTIDNPYKDRLSSSVVARKNTVHLPDSSASPHHNDVPKRPPAEPVCTETEDSE